MDSSRVMPNGMETLTVLLRAIRYTTIYIDSVNFLDIIDKNRARFVCILTYYSVHAVRFINQNLELVNITSNWQISRKVERNILKSRLVQF